MTESFAPSVLMSDGTTYKPRGWEWVLAFALRGCEWAVKEASDPGFREIIIKDLKKSKREELKKSIDTYLIRIEELKKELRILDE